MNSKNIKPSAPHRLLLNFTNKIDGRKDRYIALSNLSIYKTWKNIKMSYKEQYQLEHGMTNLNYLMEHILYQIFKIILNTY